MERMILFPFIGIPVLCFRVPFIDKPDLTGLAASLLWISSQVPAFCIFSFHTRVRRIFGRSIGNEMAWS